MADHSDLGFEPAAQPGPHDDLGFVPTEPRTAGGFAKNIGKSSMRLVGDVAGAVAHPGDTLAGVTGLFEGMAEKSGFPAINGQSHQENVDALANLYKQRYGSMDNFAKTLYEDPVGVMADVATLANAGGAAFEGVKLGAGAAGMARTAQVAGKVAQVAGKVGEFTDPLALAGKAVAPMAKGVAAVTKLDTLPERLYGSALKAPPSWYSPDEAKAIAQTGLRERIPVSEGGLQKLYGLIGDANQKIRDVIQNGAAGGATVDPEKVALRADQIKSKFLNQVNATEDLNAIEASKQQWRTEQGARPAQPPQPTGLYDASGNPIMTAGKPAVPAQPIPADRAQAIKQGTYAQLKDKAFGELKSASIESQKALARGIKEELATVFPEISALNARDSKLLNLEDALERGVRRIGNHQLFGIGTPILAGGVGAATHSAGAAAVAGTLRAIIENPQVKSQLAILLSSGKGVRLPGMPPPSVATALSRIQEYVTALGSAQPAAQPGQ